MRAVVYLRQSQDREGNEYGVTRQLQDARTLAERRDWTIVATHVDNDVSAAGKRKRPGFEAVLAALDDGHAEAVIAWEMSRLTRNRRDTLRLLEVGEKRGATLAFVRGSDLDLSTPAGQLTADVLAGVARHEITLKSDRQRRAVEQAAADGRRVGGRRPFAYESDGMTVRSAEAAALRDGYNAVLSGAPLARIARVLNEQGLCTPQKTRTGEVSTWTAQTIRSTLLNPRNAGLRAVKVGRDRYRIVTEARWPAVVTEDVWRAAVAVLVDPSRSTPARSGQAMLTGLALCGVPGCGSTVHRGANRLGQATYRCRAATGHVVRRAAPVDDWVSEVVIARLSRSDAVDLLVDHDRPDVDQLRAELVVLRTRRRSLVALVADGTYTEDEVREQAERLAGQIGDLEAKTLDAGRVDILGPLVRAVDVRAEWKAMDDDRRRAVIGALMTVTLLPIGRGTRTFRRETVVIEPKGQP